MELKELMSQLETMKATLETNIEEKANKNIDEKIAAVNAAIEAVKNAKPEVTAEEIAQMKSDLDATIKAFDLLQNRMKVTDFKPAPVKKSFGDAFTETITEAFETKKAEFDNFKTDRKAKIVLDMKAVGNMTLGANLTGDGVAAYNSRQGLVPSQAVNFRDLIPSVSSPTGLYVTYRETGTEGAIAVQTEGAAKGQIDYDLTEVKVVSDYIAGFARFSKQMMYQLPFLQGTLQRMLLRDFYKKENSTFFTAVSGAATGSTTVVSTVHAEELIELIANQRTADFEASMILVAHAEWSRIIRTKPSDYSVPGGFSIDTNGTVRIAGVPVIPASWVTDDKALIIDSNFLERVETESLRVELSYEDGDNFTKNLVTARVECFEDINMLRTDSVIYADLTA